MGIRKLYHWATRPLMLNRNNFHHQGRPPRKAIMHIAHFPHISTKFINFPIFRQNFKIPQYFLFMFFFYFEHDAYTCMHHCLRALDAPALHKLGHPTHRGFKPSLRIISSYDNWYYNWIFTWHYSEETIDWWCCRHFLHGVEPQCNESHPVQRRFFDSPGNKKEYDLSVWTNWTLYF